MTAAQHSTLFLLLKSARPRQWIKNIALFASLVFSGFFFAVVDGQIYLLKVSYATGVFCLLTSAIYIFNDLNDREVDRLHPFKSKRPIASGALDSQIALAVAVVALVTSLFLALWLSPFFFLVIAAYVGLQVLYSRVTKHIPILDVLSIATGFLLRVYAGAVVVNLHMSVWFLLTVVSASLFFAVGKRQSERTLLKGQEMFGETRKTLKRYSERLLDLYTGMFANSTWLTYALYTFERESVKPEGGFLQLLTILPRTLQSQKLLMLTIPLVIFGIMRYLQLVYEANQGESPEKVLLSDKPLVCAAVTFAVLVMVVIYVL